MNSLISMGEKAKKAASELAVLSTDDKNKLLTAISNALKENIDIIISENEKDLKNAVENGMSASLQDRLKLDADRINTIASDVLEVVALDDPIGIVLEKWERPNGLLFKKVTVPIGVIAIIYEARPNVTVDSATLCLKSSNAVILRGGKEAINSNLILAKILRDTIKKAGYNEDFVQIVENTARETSVDLMKLDGFVDLLIPRGSASLIKAAVQNATVPVIETGTGNCHIFIDYNADIDMGVDILFNAKTQRPSVCNAAESLLVHSGIAKEFLIRAKKKLDTKNVELRGCPRTMEILKDITKATEEDYYKEYGDYILSVKIVDDVQEAINHINKYNTHHSEAIITNDLNDAYLFERLVDAAAVYVNASTRFTDGNEFGFGSEIGISTSKIHARGPMGLRQLTSIKYLIEGNGQIR
ncbi:MAG: glutamate-5-semialdehyde dehydrogenase [Clostridia bacterium]